MKTPRFGKGRNGPRGGALLALLAALLCGAAQAAGLDQKAIHASYEEGDFDKVLVRIEDFQKSHASYSREDSVFIAKHLAVIYAANPETLEKGKYWMYQMLRVMPAADLVGMYVSEEIDRIFDKIRVEFTRRQVQFGVDTARMVLPPKQPKETGDAVTAAATPASKSPPKPKTAVGKSRESSGWKTGLWVAGGLGVAAAGAATYFLLAGQEGGTRIEEVDIPKQAHP